MTASMGLWWLELVRILLNSTGPGGRCCHLRVSICSGFEGHVSELPPDFCATGLNGVQLRGVLLNKACVCEVR